MALSNLCKVVKLSPNCSKPRNHSIDRLTYHHMAGVLSAQSCVDWFVQTRAQSSANYCIGYDGTIAGCVDEVNRPWTTSSRENDNRAITFELSNSAAGKNWPVSDATIEAAIHLTVDICKRHGKTRLLWFADKEKSLAYQPKANELVVTVHHWFANTDCPGPYLESKLPYIVETVNAKLAVDNRKWYEKSGEWALAQKLGITDGTRPDDPCTRAEAAAMIVRALNLKEGK